MKNKLSASTTKKSNSSKNKSKNLSFGDLAKLYPPDQENEEKIEYEILNDPIWSPALEALQKKGDIKQIGNLLKKFSPPDWVAKEIGIMMSPPKSYRGLVVVVDKRKDRNKRQKAIDEIKRKIELRTKLIQAGAEKSLKRARYDVEKNEKLGRTTLMNAWKFKGKERTLQSLKILGYIEDPINNKKK